MTFFIGITNQKGGVGKTTTAINLAAGLALAGRSTLLVDMDPQGNATSGLGVNRESLEHTVMEALMGQHPPQDCLVGTGVERLSLLPADMRLIAAERDLLRQEHREAHLAKALRPLASRFQYIIIDSPPTLGLLTINVLRAVNHLLIPVQSEYYALEGLSSLVETVIRAQASVNPQLEILGVLMTMVDGRTNLARQVVEEVLKHFGDKVFKTVVARSVRLSEAPSHGQAIMLYDPRCPATVAHQNLTQEVIHRCEGESTPNRVSSNHPEKQPQTAPLPHAVGFSTSINT